MIVQIYEVSGNYARKRERNLLRMYETGSGWTRTDTDGVVMAADGHGLTRTGELMAADGHGL